VSKKKCEYFRWLGTGLAARRQGKANSRGDVEDGERRPRRRRMGGVRDGDRSGVAALGQGLEAGRVSAGEGFLLGAGPTLQLGFPVAG